MGHVHELLAKRANHDPGRVAFIHGRDGTAVSWGDVRARSAEWAERMGSDTERRRRLVGIALASPTSFCRTYLAGLDTGTPIAPLDPRSTVDELADRASVLALTDVVGDRLDEAQTAALTDAGARVWSLDDDELRLAADVGGGWSHVTHAPEPSVILATSGSTGRPKLVPLREEQLVHVAAQVSSHHGLRRDDRGYCPLPLFHINAQVVGVLSTLVAGSSLVVEERFHRDGFWDVVADQGASWLNLVPAMLAALSALEETATAAPPGVRFARSASSPLSDAVRERFESLTGIGILETYGMTEAASQITANPLAVGARRPGSVGRPVGIEVRVLDQDGVARPAITGSVQIRGVAVVDHYLTPGRIDSVPTTGPDGWLTTGDLGRLDGDGYLYLVGRSDDVINRGGEKVYPREIEEVLLRDARVTDAVATGRPHPSLGSQPVAYVATSLPEDGRERLALELARSCETALSRYKRPAEIFVTDSLPVGATGKVSRRRLAELFELAAAES